MSLPFMLPLPSQCQVPTIILSCWSSAAGFGACASGGLAAPASGFGASGFFSGAAPWPNAVPPTSIIATTTIFIVRMCASIMARRISKGEREASAPYEPAFACSASTSASTSIAP